MFTARVMERVRFPASGWRLNESKTPRRAWDVRTGKDLDVSIDGSYLTTTLRDIGQYAIVAVEY